MPFATTTDGARLFYEVVGTGEPLLLIAGNGSDHRGWSMLVPDFASAYRVITYDHRGTGDSDQSVDPQCYTPARFADDAVAVLNAAGAAKAHVYGVSMGGAVAQWVGINHCHRVGALVLAATSPGGASWVARPAAVNEALRSADPAVKRRALLAIFYSPEWAEAHPELVVEHQAGMTKTSPAMQQLHSQVSPAHDPGDRLAGIAVPTLVLHGGDDPRIPVETARQLADRIPGAEFQIVSGGRHAFMVEHRLLVSLRVQKFLRQHPLS